MTDINELYSRDPLSLTNEDIEAIIADMRDKRHRFGQGDPKAGSVKPKAPPKGVAASQLSDLLGGIKI